MVPEGWEVTTIGAIATVKSGGTPSRSNGAYWNGSIPWVTTAEINYSDISATKEKISEEGLQNSSATLFPIGTILMAMYGQGKTRGQVAKLGIEAATNQACAALLLSDTCETNFYYQYLTYSYEDIRDLSNSGGQKNLSAGIVKSIKAPHPPLPEQRKIAKILQTWDRAIATTEKLIAASKQQKKALMQQLLTGKKRFGGFEGESEWRRISLGELCSGNLQTGPFGSQLHANEYTDTGVAVLMPKDLIDCRANPDSAAKISEERAKTLDKHRLKNGDLIFSRRGNVSRFALIDNDSEGCICGTGCLKAVPNEEHSSKFLSYYLQKNSVRKWLVHNSVGQTMPNMNTAILAELPLAAASSKAEEEKIAHSLDSTDKQIQLLKTKFEYLKREKKALMQQLLTGKRRVKVDE